MFELNYCYDGSDKKITVYDITYDKSGFPQFLIHDDGEWIRKSAKYFSPIECATCKRYYACGFGFDEPCPDYEPEDE